MPLWLAAEEAAGRTGIAARRVRLIAVISDVHANLEALRAVLEEMGSVKEMYCAGDIVGYGPNPNECCEIVQERNIKCVMGNHDIVCATYGELESDNCPLDDHVRELAISTRDEMNEIARGTAEWTYAELTEENREWLRGLPLELKEKDTTVIHGSVGSDYDRLNTYLDEKFNMSSAGGAEMSPDDFYREMLDEVESKVLIVGHTHIPSKGYFFKHNSLLAALPFFARERWVVNPGSVGQPRKGRKANYALITMPIFPYFKIRASFHYLERNVKHHTVAYDRQKTIEKIQRTRGFDEKMRFMLTRWL